MLNCWIGCGRRTTLRGECLAATTASVQANKDRTMTETLRILLLPLFAVSLMAPSVATEIQPVIKRQQYVYVLHLTPRMHETSAWTAAENGVIGQHFARLAIATETGQVILAGRTSEALDKTFGLVIFEAETEESARLFMESDPAVVANIMTATLHPYSVALQRKR
jgi:uncharacterized protein YciI